MIEGIVRVGRTEPASTHDMRNSSQIVCGGGWHGTSLARIKLKAWVALFTAIVLARISVTASSSVWMICAAVLAALIFLAAILFFIREKPRDVQFPQRRAGHDPRKFYSVAGARISRDDVNS
jgi:hypothetical protein